MSIYFASSVFIISLSVTVIFPNLPDITQNNSILFSRSITKLKQVSTLFLTTIVKSKSKLPYGMLYMAKVLYNALRRKFPATPEKEVLKVKDNRKEKCARKPLQKCQVCLAATDSLS